MSNAGFSTENLTSAKLNKYGFELYKQNKYAEAAEIFRSALIMDFDTAIAHYNRACMLALLFDQGKKVNLDVLFTHLRRSISLDHSHFQRMQNDSDLNAVRDLPEYKETLANYPYAFQKPAKLKKDFFIGTWIGEHFGMEIKESGKFEYRGKFGDYIHGKWIFEPDFQQITLVYPEVGPDPSFQNIDIISIPYYRKSENINHKQIKFSDGYILGGYDGEVCEIVDTGNKDQLIKKIVNGLDVNSPIFRAKTIIQYAALDENHANAYNLVKLLIELGANTQAIDQENTPFIKMPLIHSAVKNKNIKLLSYLLDIGINPNEKDQFGQNPLSRVDNSMVAEKILKKLLSAGIDINSTDNYNRTSLHKAILYDYYRLAELLISYGIDIHIRDYKDKEAIDYADDDTPVSILELLKSGDNKEITATQNNIISAEQNGTENLGNDFNAINVTNNLKKSGNSDSF